MGIQIRQTQPVDLHTRTGGKAVRPAAELAREALKAELARRLGAESARLAYDGEAHS